MMSHLWGSVGNFISLVLLCGLSSAFNFRRTPKRKVKLSKVLVLLIVIISSISIFYLETKIWPLGQQGELINVWEPLSMLLFNPVLEEFVFRYFLFGVFVKAIEEKFSLKQTIALVVLLPLILLFPKTIFHLFGKSNLPTEKEVLSAFLVSIFIIFVYWIKQNSKKELRKAYKVVFFLSALFIQSLIFGSSHGERARHNHFINGFFYGILYLVFGNLYLPIISHIIMNFSIQIICLHPLLVNLF